MTVKTYIFIFSFFSLSLYASECKKPSMPSNEEWNIWLKNIKIEALKEGITENTIDEELSNIQPQKKIILRDRCQPESTITLHEYLYYRLDKSRINAGKKFYKKYKNELNEISKVFNVQPRFIVAILGLESFYGKNQGKVKTMEAITTLAFDRRRSDFYKKQLFAALKIIDNGLIESNKLLGSWGGAVGMSQMIPTTYVEYGYDFDEDGFVDIWNNYHDTFASIANYLTSIENNPWSYDSTWGREVLPPENLASFYDSLKQKNAKGCYGVRSRSIPKNLSEWKKLGFKSINGEELPNRNDLEARLVAPDGLDGRIFLVYPNYKLFLYYNCSSYYAISIGLLSDEFKN